MGLKTGDRGGRDTGASGPRPVRRPGQCLPTHSRTAGLKCAGAPWCINQIRCCVRNILQQLR
jgi:hypothetical protein